MARKTTRPEREDIQIVADDDGMPVPDTIEEQPLKKYQVLSDRCFIDDPDGLGDMYLEGDVVAIPEWYARQLTDADVRLTPADDDAEVTPADTHRVVSVEQD